MTRASVNWLTLFRDLNCCALSLAPVKAGNNSDARMAMMAMTTSSSTNVNKAKERGSTRRLQRFVRCILASGFSLSFMPQRLHRMDLSRASRRQQSRQQGDKADRENGGDTGENVKRRDFDEK